MRSPVHLIILLLSIAVCSCNLSSDKKSPRSESITLREAWFPWAGYAGEILAEEIAKQKGIDFKVEQGAEDIDPIKMVLSGTNDFGIASAENLILANLKGADLVAVGALNYKSATCYIALKNKGITTLKDFENRKVGVLTATETETIYRLLLAKNNINTNLITEVEAPFDLTTFISTDAYDIRPAFFYDEAVTLDINKIEYTIIEPEDYGVQMIGAVYFTTKKMISDSPEKVQGFIDVLGGGWEKTIANPKEAIESLLQYDPNIDSNRELASLTKGIEYFSGENGKVLFASDSTWSALKRDLEFLGKIPENFDIHSCYDNTYVMKYHKNGFE